MKKKNYKITSYLSDINILFSIFTVFINIIVAFFTNGNKIAFTYTLIYLNVLLLFSYYIKLLDTAKKHLTELKHETMFINYPFRIALLFVLLAFLLFASYLTLYFVNREAANAAFSFTFFMSIISMIMPSGLFAVIIYFIVPAFIIPGLTSKSVTDKSKIKTTTLILILFVLGGFLRLVTNAFYMKDLTKKDKYKISVMNVGYPTEYLKIHENISAYAKKKMSKDFVEIPFLYTSETFSFDDYNDAEKFCQSIGARVPNYLEIYHVIFNKFETFGNGYFLTSDNDGKNRLALHFNNMSYTVEKLPQDAKPILYCVSDVDSGVRYGNASFFVRVKNVESDNDVNAGSDQPFTADKLEGSFNNKQKYSYSDMFKMSDEINQEKKHVSFSIKEVSSDIFQRLVMSGYNYNSSPMVLTEYETNDAQLKRMINRDGFGNEIRLCYFPFINYPGLSIDEEKVIWSQSFCSPAFRLLNTAPALKSNKDKNNYCSAGGGRLPNIPELYGILKTLDVNLRDAQYWTYNQVNGKSVVVINKDGNFADVKTIPSYSTETAYAYCITQSDKTSRIISNYSSRFKGISGRSLAKQLCPECTLYELPDVLLMNQ